MSFLYNQEFRQLEDIHALTHSYLGNGLIKPKKIQWSELFHKLNTEIFIPVIKSWHEKDMSLLSTSLNQ